MLVIGTVLREEGHCKGIFFCGEAEALDLLLLLWLEDGEILSIKEEEEERGGGGGGATAVVEEEEAAGRELGRIGAAGAAAPGIVIIELCGKGERC